MFDFEKGRIKFIHGGKYPHCHSVFIDDKIRAVIDPASDENKLKQIQHKRAVDVLINSHSHEDHILFNYLFCDAALWVHALDAPAFRDVNYFIDQFGLPTHVDGKLAREWLHFLTDVIRYQPREPDRLLEDDEIIDFGQTRMQVLHTPGHSPGHLAFFFPEEKVLFLADLDLVKFGPYYGDRASDIDATIRSLQRLVELDAEVYLTAHGKEGIYAGDPEHIYRYLNVIYKRENALLDFLSAGPRKLAAIVQKGIIYGGRTLAEGAWDLAQSEKAMMLKHLERLERLGKVCKRDNRYFLNFA